MTLHSDGNMCHGLTKIGGISLDDLQMIDDNGSDIAATPSPCRVSPRLYCSDEISSYKDDISQGESPSRSWSSPRSPGLDPHFPSLPLPVSPIQTHTHGPSLFQCSQGCFGETIK